MTIQFKGNPMRYWSVLSVKEELIYGTNLIHLMEQREDKPLGGNYVRDKWINL